VEFGLVSATPAKATQQRSAQRRKVSVPARLMWKDSRGAVRFASGITRDISEHGVFIECTTAAVIPLYRLVHVQLEREARDHAEIPEALRDGKVLSAVYRVGPYRRSTGAPEGYALRLLIEPQRQATQQRSIA
jgi:PilZ domain